MMQQLTAVDSLEPRRFFSAAATVELSVSQVGGTAAAPVYTYDIKVSNTGTTTIGTFWFGWMPGKNFLPTPPQNESSPTGWQVGLISDHERAQDGTGIEWVAASTAARIAPGASLSGFTITTTDGPAVLAGLSPFDVGVPVLTSTIYSGAAFSDGGLEVVGTVNPQLPVGASSPVLLTVGGSSFPATVIARGALKGVLSVDVTGPVGQAVKGPITLDLLASTDATADAADVVLTSMPLKAGLKADKHGIVKFHVKSLPASLSAGNYTLLVRATDTDSLTTVTPGPSLIVQAPVVQLSEVFSKITLPMPSVAGAMLKGSAILKITNDGNVSSSGSSTVQLFLSTDMVLDEGDAPLAMVSKVLKMAAGKASSVKVPIKQIPSVSAGMYYAIAKVVDGDQQMTQVVSGSQISVVVS